MCRGGIERRVHLVRRFIVSLLVQDTCSQARAGITQIGNDGDCCLLVDYECWNSNNLVAYAFIRQSDSSVGSSLSNKGWASTRH